MDKSNGLMEKFIRGVPNNGKKTMPLDGEIVASWRAKVSQINKADGYTHYSVAVSAPLNILGIVNNGDRQD